MNESLSALPQQLEFNFEGYENEVLPLSENIFEKAETLTLEAICSAPDFTDLFEDAKCISRIYDVKDINHQQSENCKKEAETKGVYFVFKAHDAVTGQNIAIKVTNPAYYEAHPNLTKNLEWESAVLTKLKNKSRMQQILIPLKTSKIKIKNGSEIFNEEVSFFSSKYLAIDVKKSFFDENNDNLKTCSNRLSLFCSIISAVQMLHREGFCHRDLKPSNIMGIKNQNGKCSAVLIDFGLSIAKPEIEKELKIFSPNAEVPQMYAAPEIYSGFEDNWQLSQSADIYSLGCMLFELLDERTFYTALLETNDRNYWQVVNEIYVGKEEFNKNNEKRLELYNERLSEFSKNIIIPRIAEDSILPNFVKDEIQEIISNMCNFDYRKRTKEEELDDIKQKIYRIIKVLENAHLRDLYKKRKEIKRKRHFSFEAKNA